MKIGINIRVMGEQSSAPTMAQILQNAESVGIESAWVVDHIAIPPDDAEGSGGRYLDPLSTLAWMAGQTKQIKLGTSVLILPYRPRLPTAKAIATIQELSNDRLLLGVGIGWMEPEFKALGVPRNQRGKRSDETLAFLREAFSNDVVSLNDQEFLFKPRPTRPPIYVGGMGKHAIDRAIKYGDGWMPMGKIEKLRPEIDAYKERAKAAGVNDDVVTFLPLPEDLNEAQERVDLYREAGVTRGVVTCAYNNAEDWQSTFELIDQLRF